MNTPNFTPPKYGERAFHCQYCGTYCYQGWTYEGKSISITSAGRGVSTIDALKPLAISQCYRCREVSLWLDKKLIYPDRTSVERANPDLPDDVKELYDEAASILQKSPRAAAALLRVALEKLCKEQGEERLSLSQNIDLLKEKGEILEEIYESMTVVRVVGNQAVHPGKIEFESNETPEIVISLFEVINFIAENMITKKKRAKAIYEKVRPQEKSPAPK